MRLTSPTVTPEAWAFTDLDGRIESASRAMSSVLGVGRLRRGEAGQSVAICRLAHWDYPSGRFGTA